MKKLVLLIAIAGLVFSAGSAFGQATVKLGHLDTNELISSMPETDSASTILENSAQEIQDTMDKLQVEYRTKYEEYIELANEPTTSALILRTKEEELTSLQTRAQNFSASAEQDYADQQARLFQPIQEKAMNAIEEVARENGFTYIFDTSVGSIVFVSDDSIDILPLVKQKLGLP